MILMVIIFKVLVIGTNIITEVEISVTYCMV